MHTHFENVIIKSNFFQSIPFSLIFFFIGGAWSPKINDQMQYLQIAFAKPTPLHGVMMRGHPLFDQYVTSFKILHSYDGVAFHYLVDETKHPQIFSGPIDSRTPVRSLFKIPVEAKMVRIYPLTWNGGIAIRAELLGCSLKELEEAKPTAIIPAPIHLEEIHELILCDEPLGVDNGKMKPNQIVVSSTKMNVPKSAAYGMLKLSSSKGWRPNIDSPNEYVLFDFLEPRNITGVKTKGGEYGWVTGFTVLYSLDKFVWNTVSNPDGTPKVFLGNYDTETAKMNPFQYAINARYLKVVPTKWHETVELSIEPIGCFKPYPYKEDHVVEIFTLPPEQQTCGICPGVLYGPVIIENTCRCYPPLYWNGDECVARATCPCMVGHITYGVGALYELDDCSKCVCVLGGVAQCKPLECPPCGAGLRKVQSVSCLCQCQPCPVSHVLCISSGACIPESSWCNGIQDCPDDELECSYKKHDTTKVIEKIIEKVTIIQKCTRPSCPPGFKVKVSSKKGTDKLSAMLQTSNLLESQRNGKLDKKSSDDSFVFELPTPKKVEADDSDECVQFDCIPINPDVVHPANQVALVCPTPECPKGYEVVLDVAAPQKCAKYKCEPLPQNDAVCNVTGRTFNTFDDTTFKYDICNHLLARDLVGNKWSVSSKFELPFSNKLVEFKTSLTFSFFVFGFYLLFTVLKNCSSGSYICKKELIIKDKENDFVIRLYTDLSLTLDEYPFTVEQLQKSTSSKLRSFVISKVGNTIVFVSHTHGFWVRFDESGDIKIGISTKYNGLVDGLCGFFNGNPVDDKRLPNGEQTLSTVDFGDAWLLDKDSKQKCAPHACSQEMQDTAWEICNKIKDESFSQCKNAVDIEHFISKCLETTCDCLNAGSGNAESFSNTKGACKCSILQSFVSECLAADESIHLDTWRSIHGCYKECPAPLVHKDCFRRRCEPSCTFISGEDCPSLPGTCFSGCYCPEGTVRKGDLCVPVSECKNCVCSGFGKSQYLTYDRKNFTFDGNCTYLLSRDILIPGVHTFQVYVTMGPCDQKSGNKSPKNTCSQALHILYGPHIIHLQKSEKSPQVFETLIDGVKATIPYKCPWLEVTEEQGKGININFVESQVEVNALFNDLSFSIKLPSVKYGSKLEGLCGDCNGNPNDDLKPNPKYKSSLKSEDLYDILQTWLSDEPSLPKEENCVSEEKSTLDCIPLPPESDPCLAILDEATFGQCHLIVEPLVYLSSCQTDMCKTGPNQKGACSHLAAYARECSQNGMCISWKNGVCKDSVDCPDGMAYESCGCTRTCDNQEFNSTAGKCPLPEYDGCFCPKGKVLNSGKCIAESQCHPCDDKGHFYGDKWHPDKCTECQCESNGKTQCLKQQCTSTGNICEKGFKEVVVEVTTECCPQYKCVPDLVVNKTCTQPLIPDCGFDQYKKIDIDHNGCTRFICECMPLDQCKPLENPPLRAGETLITDKSGCCPVNKVVCDKSTCPAKILFCEEEYYEIVPIDKVVGDACCEEFKCIPPRDHCIAEINGKKQLKTIDEVWMTKDPCVHNRCAFGEGGRPVQVDERQKCEITSCDLGYKLEISDGKCCGICVPHCCLVDGVVHEPNSEWKSPDGCTSFKCSDTFLLSSMQDTCPDVTHCPPHLTYFENCCQRCKLEPENKRKCPFLSYTETAYLKFTKKKSHKFR